MIATTCVAWSASPPIFTEKISAASPRRSPPPSRPPARQRSLPFLMTSCAMIAGMIPMALAIGEGGEQTAPLGRAVIGGLIAATLTTLIVIPFLFGLIQAGAKTQSVSLDPTDPDSE